mgnify:FL=1
MKKKALSAILALCMILGNCSSTFVAIAEDETPSDSIVTDDNGENSTTPDEDGQDTDTSGNEDNNPTDDDQHDNQKSILTVETIDDKLNNLTLYYGQNPVDILNYQMGNGNPRFSEYFRFVMQDTSEVLDDYDAIRIVDKTDRTIEENPLNYTLGFEIAEDCEYSIDSNYSFSLNCSGMYNPSVSATKVNIDNKVCLQAPEGFLISDSNEESTFSSDPLPMQGTYYLRNNQENSLEYLAISVAMGADSNPDIIMPDHVTVSGIDLSDSTATNRDVTISFKTYAWADSIKVSLNREGTSCISEKEIAPSGKSDAAGRNEFIVNYTFTAPTNNLLHVKNIDVIVEANGVRAERTSLQLQDENTPPNPCYDFIIETKKPVNFHPDWGKDRYDNGNKIIPFLLSEYETEIKKIEYSFDKRNWTAIDEYNRNGNDYTFDFSMSVQNYGSTEIYFRATDAAGNERYCIRTKNMNDLWLTDDRADNAMGSQNIEADVSKLLDAIDSIEFWYSNESSPSDSDWVQFTEANASQFHTYSFGNAINKQWMQIRVKSGTEKVFFINGTALTAHNSKIDTDDDGEPDKTVVDYYYYDIKSGSDCYAVISVKDRNNRINIEALSDKIDNGLKIENSYIVVDTSSPSSKLNRPDFASLNAAVSNKWYGIKEKDGQDNYFTINVSDNASGIYSLAISDNGSKIVTNGELPPVEFTINNGSAETHSNGELATQYYNNLDSATKDIQVKIPLALFNDGDHTLKITVIDNAGNTETGFAIINSTTNKDSDGANKPFEFSTDYNSPTGSIAILNLPDPIDGKYWYDGSATVQFQFAINDSNPNKVVWKANNASEVEVKYTDPDTTVTQSTADTNASLDGNHSYTISAKFYDQAGNCSEDGATDAKTFYKDTETPTIDSVSVSRAPESGFGKVLRILTFGIFSNDTVTVTVTAHDGEHDSGLNNNALKISLDDGATYNGMDFQDGKYKYTISIPDTPQSGYFTFKVTDQFGHYSELTKESEDGNVSITADGETPEDSDRATDSKFYMFETIPPSVSIDLPESDGVDVVARPDTCTWFNSDKDITITVSDENSGIHNIAVTVNDEAILTDSENVNFISKCAVMDNDSHKYRLSTEGLREILRNSGKLPGDGHYIVKVTAEDNSGNIKEDSVDYFLDYDAPAVIKIEFSIPSEEGGLTEGDVFDAAQYIEKLQYGYYFKTDLTATVHISDVAPSSELHRIHYELVSYNNGVKGDTVDSGTVAINSQRHEGDGTVDSKGTAQFTIPKDFKGQILVTAYDYVGNESAERTPDLFVVDTPEHHESESHIDISGFGNAGYSDGEGHPLYDSNVTLTVKITDTMSGIRQISYEMNSEQNKQEKKTIDIANTGNAMNQDLGDGWHITAMDENLVTEVTKEYTFSSDDNNIQLLFEMTDRSNNSSAKQSDVFSIDQTAPVINVAFANAAGNGEFYRESRTATITVTERNFDPNKIIASIQNSIGGTPTLGFTDNSNTEHVATLTFGEGDYSFSIDGTDLCNHTATVNYSGGNEQSFHVDLKDPLIVDNFTDFINDLENSFNVDKEMTFTITEHNFTANGVNIHVYRVPAGQELTDGNREDCTSEYVTDNMWTSNGDTHNAGFTFSTDYVYQVSITVTDKSGRTPATLTSPVFEIDKTKPVLKTPDNRDKLVYTKKSTQTEADSIVFEDSNIDKIAYSVVAYQMELNEDNVGYDVKVSEPKKFEVNTDSVIISDDYFKNDGIYEVKSVAYDVAGNASDESTHTYVIQRNTDFLVYIPDSNKENQTGLYKFNEKGIRSADFEDIEIISYVTADKSVGVRVGDEDVEGDDIDVKELRGSDLGGDKKNDETINQVTAYDLTLKNSFIAQNYDSDTIDTDLLLNAVASTEDAQQVITLGHIYIDNVKPVGEYEQAIQNLGFFDGFYGVESRSVMIEGVSPDIDLDRCEIQANDLTLKAADGGFVYDENAHTISFTINKGYTDIRPTLVDKAGNINNLPLVKKVYVGGVFARFWYLFIFGGLLVLAIPTLIIMALIKKKKSQPIFK